ncbi:unnamed protein product [Closterium sp. Naga37s-1]|nr:unnamed protein product [Closterium sp. Naga37s-1]
MTLYGFTNLAPSLPMPSSFHASARNMCWQLLPAPLSSLLTDERWGEKGRKGEKVEKLGGGMGEGRGVGEKWHVLAAAAGSSVFLVDRRKVRREERARDGWVGEKGGGTGKRGGKEETVGTRGGLLGEGADVRGRGRNHVLQLHQSRLSSAWSTTRYIEPSGVSIARFISPMLYSSFLFFPPLPSTSLLFPPRPSTFLLFPPLPSSSLYSIHTMHVCAADLQLRSAFPTHPLCS